MKIIKVVLYVCCLALLALSIAVSAGDLYTSGRMMTGYGTSAHHRLRKHDEQFATIEMPADPETA